uniref:Extracellular ligand-gated ion channel n=1 Tax=Kalanchoe fedtschenkoi TaxID=63787 RepID=A0A7N0T6F4_KALFE
MGEPLRPLLPKRHFARSKSHADDELRSFRSCLRWMCVDQSSIPRAILSWSMFVLFTIAVPALSHFLLSCSDCDAKHRRPYDGVVQLSLSSVAALSFLCLSRFVMKYGLRRFLFLDKLCHESHTVATGYTQQLNRSLKILAVFVLPCFAAESSYKIWWYTSGSSRIPFLGNVYASDAVACTLELLSWLYRTSVFFLLCILFRLICHLQILRLQDFAKVFQVDSDVGSILTEHLRIRRHLRIISHRYRAFILWALLLITGSQFASLLITTKSRATVNIFRAGELALVSVTLLAGLFILLRSATKITHKAQAVTCLATKWHVSATVDSFDATDDGETPPASIANANANAVGFPVEGDARGSGHSDTDDAGDEEDEVDNTEFIPAYARSTISFQKRQALVTYLENNKAGITAYGFMLDRTYIHTIFGIELSLVLWLLGKTIGIS